jgi:hypothetical protein
VTSDRATASDPARYRALDRVNAEAVPGETDAGLAASSKRVRTLSQTFGPHAEAILREPDGGGNVRWLQSGERCSDDRRSRWTYEPQSRTRLAHR